MEEGVIQGAWFIREVASIVGEVIQGAGFIGEVAFIVGGGVN